ncbi:MAG: helix-turn-helix domain-containing protein [Acidimicrobiales bacterium]
MAPADGDKQTKILDAALEKFSAYGFSRTSMVDISEAAGMSRPALYQHYANKEEIFRAMLGRILDDAADRAIACLEDEVGLESQLDGFLQRWFGDMAETLRATQHGSDLIEAKAGHAKPVVEVVNHRIRAALIARLRDVDGDPGLLADLLLLGPHGLKYDEPSMAKLRRRLGALATTVARSTES